MLIEELDENWLLIRTRHLTQTFINESSIMARRRKEKIRKPGNRVATKASVSLAGPNGHITKAREWDHGTETLAALFSTVVEGRGELDPETGRMSNPNGVTGRRRVDVIEWYYRSDLITARQFSAARLLVMAWEQTQKSSPAVKAVQVDTSPKPDQNIAVMIDRIGGYHRIARHIPDAARAYIQHVVMDNRHITSMPGYRRNVYMNRLRAGLEKISKSLEGI